LPEGERSTSGAPHAGADIASIASHIETCLIIILSGIKFYAKKIFCCKDTTSDTPFASFPQTFFTTRSTQSD
jgi:hypothetical protein